MKYELTVAFKATVNFLQVGAVQFVVRSCVENPHDDGDDDADNGDHWRAFPHPVNALFTSPNGQGQQGEEDSETHVP